MVTEDKLFARVETLAENDRDVQDAVRTAEALFWSRARAEDWPRNSDDGQGAQLPCWQAGRDYVAKTLPPYSVCCARLARTAAEFEKYLVATVRGLAEKVFEHKLLDYTRTLDGISGHAKARFVQHVRYGLAPQLGELKAKAWEDLRCLIPVAGIGAGSPVISESSRSRAELQAHSPSDRMVPTPVGERRALVESYKSQFDHTIPQICRRARVDPSDFYKWIKGKLPDTSSKAERIERVLHTPPSDRRVP